MKKQFALVVILTAISCCSFAGVVTQQKAQAIALNFFKVTYPDVAGHTALTASLKYTRTETDNSVDFYVFDINPAHGFVIVAANDIIIPVLAYSNQGYFNTGFEFTAVNSWVDKTSINIHRAVQQQISATTKVINLWAAYAQGVKPANMKSTGISPLVTTIWDQENDYSNPPPYLYNLFCPYNTTDRQRCLTGCVATAQAQIMRFWNYPAVGVDTFSYLDEMSEGYSYNYGRLASNFGAHAYQWPLMPDSLDGAEPLTQDSAVDLLMYDCAVSVGMDFGDDNQDGSGANALLAEELQFGDSNCSQQALVKYFWYNADTIKGIFKDNFTDSAWLAVIEHELNVGRPVLYEGNDTTQGGHAWVCDGYDVNDNLHMNWGWSGFEDGYFAIGNLTTAGNFNPILEDDALIGILPRHWDTVTTNFAASFTSTCNGKVQFHDLSQHSPTWWLWDFGDGSTSNRQNPVHVYTANGTYTVQLIAANAGGFAPAKTITDYITVNLLQSPVATGATITAPQSVSLSATTANTVAWFDSSGVFVSNANPFVTPVLNKTTTYYVEDSVVSPAAHVGVLNNQVGGGTFLSDSQAVQFNVVTSCIIQSVYLYTQNAANRTIQVLDTFGNILAQQTVHCPAGGNRAILNFDMDAGGPYFMSVADTLGLYSNATGATYPYSDSLGLLNITGNTFSSNSYLYFYDWIVKAPDCISPRVPVTVNVVSGIADVSDAIQFGMFPNPAGNAVTIQTDISNTPTVMNLTNIVGQTVISKNITGQQTVIDLSTLANGVYLVQLRQGSRFTVKQLLVAK